MSNPIYRGAFSIIICLIIVGCHRSISPIWTGGSGHVPELAQPVGGLKISPYEAQSLAEKTYGMRKTVQHVYSDSQYYYIVDGFFGSSRTSAARNGVRIDGYTGECITFEQEEHNTDKNKNKANKAEMATPRKLSDQIGS